jgi:hypothetical protein
MMMYIYSTIKYSRRLDLEVMFSTVEGIKHVAKIGGIFRKCLPYLYPPTQHRPSATVEEICWKMPTLSYDRLSWCHAALSSSQLEHLPYVSLRPASREVFEQGTGILHRYLPYIN